jgi:hypothetical protein
MSSYREQHERALIKVRRFCRTKKRREYGSSEARSAVKAERRTMKVILSMYRRWR